MTDKMEALKNHYSWYLTAMTDKGVRSVDVKLLTDAPAPFAMDMAQQDASDAKGFFSRRKRRTK